MIEIINKPLLLNLVGYSYYWQMGFNSVFKGLICQIINCTDVFFKVLCMPSVYNAVLQYYEVLVKLNEFRKDCIIVTP